MRENDYCPELMMTEKNSHSPYLLSKILPSGQTRHSQPFFLFRLVFCGFVQSLISHPIAALVLPLTGDGVLVDGGRGHGQRRRGAARPHPPQSGREDLRQDAQRARAQGTPERECSNERLELSQSAVEAG